MYGRKIKGKPFCLGTRVPRHSARGVGTLVVGMYICVGTVHNVHAQEMEAENSIPLIIYSSVNIFIALGWCSENDYGFLLMNILTRIVNT